MQPFIQMLQYRTIRPEVRFAHFCEFPLSVPPRYIFDHELVLIRKGGGRIDTELGSLAYAENSLLLIPPQIVHVFLDDPGNDFAHIAIHFDWEPRIQEQNKLSSFSIMESDPDPVSAQRTLIWVNQPIVIPNVTPLIIDLAERVVAMSDSDSPYRTMEMQSLILQLLFALVQCIHDGVCTVHELNVLGRAQAGHVKERENIIEIARQMHKMMKNLPIPVDGLIGLCQSAHFSEAHFRRLFKEQIGYAPYTYFNLLRLQKAADLLLGTNLPVQEIAYLCGYEDPKYFSRLFRQSEGMNPVEYRSSLNNRK